MSLQRQKLLVANRGEIAVRILRTAKRLQIPTIAVYTQADATAPHVSLADESIALRSEDLDPLSNSRGYLDAEAILDVCKSRGVTLVHPGYGFLSENASFARSLEQAGITWLGPSADTIELMGLKHAARAAAIEANVPVVPGSDGLVTDIEDAVSGARKIGYPVMIKSTAGGGGMGLVVCSDDQETLQKFHATQERARNLFNNDGLFLERYFPAARHIEVQVFGNGSGHVVHLGERECSVQRRYQKVIEETPSPFLVDRPETRSKICDAAVRLCAAIKYASAGTVEFLVDDITGEFFFLEMNTRLQVEHPVTEAVHPGLDIVELMIRQGIAERSTPPNGGLSVDELDQARYGGPASFGEEHIHAIEARVYCENAAAQFKPSPGTLQLVELVPRPWLRIDTWVETGTLVTPFFDPLVCKLVVSAPSRPEAIARLLGALSECKIYGPPNNLAYLRAICDSETFKLGQATTTFLNTFTFTPCAVDILSGGLETTVQDFPGRYLGMGIPRSGPMDSIAFRAANILVGNSPGTEALEVTLLGCRLYFHVATTVAITGAPVKVTIDSKEVPMWARIEVPAKSKLAVGTINKTGFRAYIAMRGGFPEIPQYLGSKSTSMGLGGYQGRALTAGDQLVLNSNHQSNADETAFSKIAVAAPTYPDHWTIYCLPGPHCDEEFITSEGIKDFFSARWIVSSSSNRMGIRLEGPKLGWARKNGGEGGSHPSNIHDSGYAFGTVNINGDTPVILTNEGPDMGGYLCLCTVASAELWKLGQLRPGNTLQFKRISYTDSIKLYSAVEDYFTPGSNSAALSSFLQIPVYEDSPHDPKLHVIPAEMDSKRPKVVFREAGDSAILVEYGDLILDFELRARIHAFETELQRRDVPGIWTTSPCIRSTMVRYNPLAISQTDLLEALVSVENLLPASMQDMTFPGRKIIFPIVLDDRWNRDALERYSRSIRDEAVYLPSNIEYLARNNGLSGGAEEALTLLVNTEWLVFGVGFYLACPFLIPIDPRCRLVGQKMNPSRTYTPRGALGIAGLVAAIYPIESPGGYQLFGRTLSPWQTWGRGTNFNPEQPWLLFPFDQLKFKVITEDEYIEVEKQFDSGRYNFEIEPTTFDMAQYKTFIGSMEGDIRQFKSRQAGGVINEEAREVELMRSWEGKRQAAKENIAEVIALKENVTESTNAFTVKSSMSAVVWKIKCSPGDIINSSEDVLMILEAMKTEINVEAGEENVGRRVQEFGRDVKPGAVVHAGDTLVVLE